MGAILDLALELSPTRVPFKGLGQLVSQGSKAILGMDALGRCPQSLDPSSARPVFQISFLWTAGETMRIVGGEALLLSEHWLHGAQCSTLCSSSLGSQFVLLTCVRDEDGLGGLPTQEESTWSTAKSCFALVLLLP